MFKTKRFISLIIAMVIMCLSVSSAFAIDSQDDVSVAHTKLYNLCWESVYDYGVTSNMQNCFFINFPGELIPCIENESLLKAREVLHETDNILKNDCTLEELEKQYDKLYSVLNSVVLSKYELQVLITFCSLEKNDNGYYSDELWSEFCEKLDNAQEVYADPDNTKDFFVTEAYFELLHSHFKLCASNTMYGDVDNDSKITIMDATYVQMVCAKLKDFNSSQLIIAKKDVAYVSEIQRYISSLSDNIVVEKSKLNTYIEYVDYSDIHSDDFRFKSWKYHWLYMDYIASFPPYCSPIYLVA